MEDKEQVLIIDKTVLNIDPEKESRRICDFMKNEVSAVYKRSGIVVGLSGGVDSAVAASLAVEAIGRQHVLGLILPERESNPISHDYAEKQAQKLDIEYRVIDISQTVDSVGGYNFRDKSVKEIIPEFEPGCRYNIVLPQNLLEKGGFNVYTLQVELPDGSILTKRLNSSAFRVLAAFASIKIRARMLHLYWEAERNGLVVTGTTNKTELILGDFCKYGDGGVDIEPLSHLYKTQIYQLAEYLGVTSEIMERPPSPDTFSLPLTDQEFFFRVPMDKIDYLLFAWENNINKTQIAGALEISEAAVDRVFDDFTSKHRTTSHLRELPHAIE